MTNGRMRLVGAIALLAATTASAADVPTTGSGMPLYVVGPTNAEDLERLSGTPWLIASGMASPDRPANRLSLIDTRTETWTALWPDEAGAAPTALDQRYSKCIGPPDVTHFSPHGLALCEDRQRGTILYAVNDGPRAGVEIFRADLSQPRPALTWIGCVAAPAGTSANAVAAMPDGGFLLSSMMPGADAASIKGLVAGEKTGMVFRWRPGRGFETVAGSRVNGANGIAVSPDGKTLFLNAWSARQIIRLPLATGGLPRSVLNVDFLPDNIKRVTADRLSVTGQAVSLARLFADAKKSGPAILVPWTTALLDPRTMRIVQRQTFASTDSFGGGTTAVRIGNDIWVGSFRADRVARFPFDNGPR